MRSGKRQPRYAVTRTDYCNATLTRAYGNAGKRGRIGRDDDVARCDLSVEIEITTYATLLYSLCSRTKMKIRGSAHTTSMAHRTRDVPTTDDTVSRTLRRLHPRGRRHTDHGGAVPATHEALRRDSHTRCPDPRLTPRHMER